MCGLIVNWSDINGLDISFLLILKCSIIILRNVIGKVYWGKV